MAIKDYRGSNLGECFATLEALKADMESNGYRVVDFGSDCVMLDDGSRVDLQGNVTRVIHVREHRKHTLRRKYVSTI